MCVILISFLTTNVLAITVTEESFKKSLTNTLGTQSSLVEVDTLNDIITFTPSDINVKYNFNNNPSFTVNMEFNTNMSEHEYKVACKPFAAFSTIFAVVADQFSVNSMYSQLYFLGQKIKNDKINKMMVGPSNLYDHDDLKEIFDTDINFFDELFSINSNKISDTGDNYKVEMTLTVNLDGDFSKIITAFGESENTNTDNNKTDISNETIGTITTEKGNENTIKVEYILYIVSGVLGLALAFIVYKVFIYSKDNKEEK